MFIQDATPEKGVCMADNNTTHDAAKGNIGTSVDARHINVENLPGALDFVVFGHEGSDHG
jgi:hypothetical protein